jgi:uncharacterized protein YqhQ
MGDAPAMRQTPSKQDFRYGGQAVIEGVMMRGRDRIAIAVRRPDGNVSLVCQSITSVSRRFPCLKWPVLRGALALVESLVYGVRALTYSANESGEEGEELTGAQMGLTVFVAFAVAIGMFMLLPTFLMGLAKGAFRTSLAFNLAEGLLRMTILVAYIYAVSRVEDVRRVFAYHGAEHKVIHAFEAGDALTVENCRRHPCAHPRCGTAFLLFVVLVSVILFSLFGWPSLWQRLALRLTLLPVIAGLSYEVLRWAARTKSPLVRPALWPGLALQRMTTREPDDQMIEVAIKALEGAAAEGDTAHEGDPAHEGGERA